METVTNFIFGKGKESEVAQLCLTLSNPMDCSPPGSSIHGMFQAKNTGVGCHFLLQEMFLTQGLNPGLPHCRQTLYHLSHQGSPPGMLFWGAPKSLQMVTAAMKLKDICALEEKI